jgi:uncharacterized protein (UPF0332 family)
VRERRNRGNRSAFYRAISKEYLAKAKRLLRKRDYRQASEKLWGAASSMVKAVADTKGWQHDGHSQLFKVIERLMIETGDWWLDTLFRASNTLHINFYEGWLRPRQIMQGLKDVERLLARLEKLL